MLRNRGVNVAADVSRRKLGPGIVRRVPAAATLFFKSPQITQNTQNNPASWIGPPRSRGGYRF